MGSGSHPKNIGAPKGGAGAGWPATCPERGSTPALEVSRGAELGTWGELALVDNSVVLLLGDATIARLADSRLLACIQMGHQYRGRLEQQGGRLEVAFERV